MAGKSMDKGRSNSSDNWGSNMAISCQRGSKMAISCQRGSNSIGVGNWGNNIGGSVGRSKRGTSIRAVDESWVSLSFSLTLGNKMSVVESVGGLVRCVRYDKRGGRSGVRSDKRAGRVGVQRGSMSVGAVGMGTLGTIGTIGGDVLSICLGFS